MKTRLWGAICACAFIVSGAVVQAAPVSGQGTWETTLLPRDLTGDGVPDAYYDTVLDITWLADANLAASHTFGLPTRVSLGTYPGDTSGIKGYIAGSNGLMNWPGAKFWIDAMNAANYLGYNDWRLPTVSPVNGSAYNTGFSWDGSTDVGYNISAPGSAFSGSTASEMAYMYYNTLGNLGFADASGNRPQPGWGLSNTGPFVNLSPTQNNVYWSGTEAPNPLYAWDFSFTNGNQVLDLKNGSFRAWPVRSGDVSAVPVPTAVWLFGSGLIGLVGVARRRR